MLRFERGSPRFEGALTLARPAGVCWPAVARSPAKSWRITTRAKLAPSGGLLDQIEAQYGPDERALKLTGTAQVRLGTGRAARRRRVGAADRSRSRCSFRRKAHGACRSRSCAASPTRSAACCAPPIAVRLGVGIDSVTLAGATLQTLRGDFSTDGTAWNLETVEFRAPGIDAGARERAHGVRVAEGVTFTGPAIVELSDPKVLLAWLEGRNEAAQSQTGALRASGDLTLGADKIAIERLKAEIDRKAIAGRLAYAMGRSQPAGAPRCRAQRRRARSRSGDRLLPRRRSPARRSMRRAKSRSPWISGVATIGGIEAKQAKAKLSFDANGLIFERVAVADLGGATLDLNGRIEALATAPRGTLTLDLDARALDGVVAVLAKYVPQSADTVRDRGAAPCAREAERAVDRGATPSRGRDRKAELVITGKAGVARINLTGRRNRRCRPDRGRRGQSQRPRLCRRRGGAGGVVRLRPGRDGRQAAGLVERDGVRQARRGRTS